MKTNTTKLRHQAVNNNGKLITATEFYEMLNKAQIKNQEIRMKNNWSSTEITDTENRTKKYIKIGEDYLEL